MEEHSDIRLSGRLMATATLICAAFAAATLIPLLHRTDEAAAPGETQAGVHPAAIASQPDAFEDYVVPPAVVSSSDTSTDPILTSASDRNAVQLTRDAGLDDDHPQTVHGSAVAMPNGRGVYVPVTVHPVTITVDGSAFAEQLSRVANGVDEMLTVQRDVLETRLIARSGSTLEASGWNAPAPHESRLNEIDATLRELTRSVETLRSESNLAVNRLTHDLEQADSAADLLQELQRTLAEHRQFLAEAGKSTGPANPRVAQHPAADAAPLVNDSVPNATDTEFAPWVEPAESTAADSASPEVPLPVEPKRRTPTWPVLPADDSQEPAPEAVPEFNADPQEEVDLDSLSQNLSDESMEAVPVIQSLSESADSTEQTFVDDRFFEAEEALLPLEADDSEPPARTAESDDQPGEADFSSRSYRSLMPEPALESRPVVFEQTVNFVMPPTSDSPAPALLAKAANRPSGSTATQRTAAVATQQNQIRHARQAEVRPAQHGQLRPVPAGTLHSPAAASMPTRLPAYRPTPQSAAPAGSHGTRHVSQNHITTPSAMPPYRSQPAAPLHRRQANPLQQGVADGVDAVKDFGNDLRDRAADLMGRPQRRTAPSPADGSTSPSLLQRLGSAVRQAGRGRTVE